MLTGTALATGLLIRPMPAHCLACAAVSVDSVTYPNSRIGLRKDCQSACLWITTAYAPKVRDQTVTSWSALDLPPRVTRLLMTLALQKLRKTFLRKNLIYAWSASHNTVYLIYPETAKLPNDRFGHW